jgi:hypothetical protein
MMTAVLLVTAVVPTVKVALVFPAAIVTMMGRFNGGLLFVVDTKTSLPPDGAGALIVTVPLKLLPPATLVGLKLSEETGTPGVTAIEADTVLLPRVAVIKTPSSMLLVWNPFVAIEKVALVAPAGTVTLNTHTGVHTPFAGNVTRVLLETNPTTEPPAGAAPLKVTVPVDVPPFAMVVGFNVSDEMVRVEVADAEEPAPTMGTSRTASQTTAAIVLGFTTLNCCRALIKVLPYVLCCMIS